MKIKTFTGAPLVDAKKLEVIGILSVVVRRKENNVLLQTDCNTNNPQVYTKVAAYTDWIKDKMKN